MIGRHISRYRVVSRIGQGGMAEVYLAEDSSLGRKVALKVLPSTHAGDDSARQRLFQEAQSAASLDHPFICKIYEVGRADEQPFIAMEYVQGATLKDRLSPGAMPVDEAVRIATEIAEAVDFGHRRHIVHRDLKPANIMLTPDGHVKVMDFGVAKRMAAAATDLSTIAEMTATGEIVGTPAYMSPEQLRGGSIDARSDVFAFGLVLYEMLTGAHPYRRSTVIDTASAILNEPQPELTERMPAAPPLLAHVVERCLAKDPAKRYQSLADVRTELEAVTRGAASSTSTVRKGPAHERRWVAAAAIAILLAGGGFLLWRWSDSLPFSQNALAFQSRDWIVLADFENLTQEPVFDRSLKLAMEVGLAQSQFVNVFPPARVNDALQRMQKKVDRLDATLASEIAEREGIRGVLACSIAKVGNQYMLTAQLIDPASKSVGLTDSERADGQEQVLGALDKLATRLRRRLGESLGAMSATSVPMPQATTPSLEALRLYTDSFRTKGEGTDLLLQAIKLDDGFALAHAELGLRYYLTGSRAQRVAGEEHFVKALSLADRLTPRERLWITATAEDSRGNRERAAEAYRNYVDRYPDDARAWFRLGWTQMAGLGQYKPAEESFRHVIAINPHDSSAYVNLASTLSGQEQFDASRQAYQKSFELMPAMLTETFVNHEYGFTLVRTGDLDGAADAFRKMKAVTEPRDRKPRGMRSLALLEMYRGRYGSAIGELREAVLLHRTYGYGISEFRDRLFLGRALAAKGMSAAARAEVDAARALSTKLTLGPEWLASLGRLDARWGRLREARQMLVLAEKAAGNTLTDSTINRNLQQDPLEVMGLKGEIALAERRFAEAVTLLEAVAASRRGNDVIYSLGTALQGAGRFDQAAEAYQRLLNRKPFGLEAQEDWLAAHVGAGDVLERLNRPDAARQTYEKLLALWKDGDQDLTLRARALAGLARINAKKP